MPPATHDPREREIAEDTNTDGSVRSESEAVISHEAWSIVQSLVACDLQVSYSVEAGVAGRLVVSVSASEAVLMSEARVQKIKLRMNDTMGHLEYQAAGQPPYNFFCEKKVNGRWGVAGDAVVPPPRSHSVWFSTHQ
jgi:hypothetical protein